MRRAKALADTLDKRTIFIEDDELIVGNAASKPMAIEIDCDYGIWSPEEIGGLKKERYTISPEDEKELEALNEYWKNQTMVSRCGEVLDDERM